MVGCRRMGNIENDRATNNKQEPSSYDFDFMLWKTGWNFELLSFWRP